MIRSVYRHFEKEKTLWLIVVFAFVLRIVGVGYGLPLQIVNDETPFTLAALQMIQLHTLIPALHPAAFINILPYPPYLSYALLIPFVLILGIKYLLFHGSAALFQATLLSDLSAFFITARLINVLLGTASVWFVYRIAQRLFHSDIAAFGAAFLLATSLLHEALSMVGRNWIPVSFIFLLMLFVLTSRQGLKRRYFLTFIIAGLGMGISSLCAISLIFSAFYYLLFDCPTTRQLKKEAPFLIGVSLIFAALAALPYLLWHAENGFVKDLTLVNGKDVLSLMLSPWSAISLIVFSEPVLIVLFIGGLAFLFERHRRVAAFVLAWFLAYCAVFYILFRFDPRFLLPLLPIFSLVSGYCVSRLWSRHGAVALCILLLIPFGASVRLAYLAHKGDTRSFAREWALQHLHSSDKVLVYARGLHLPDNKASLAELTAIDPSAMRRSDDADAQLNFGDVPYALNNLYDVKNDAFFGTMATYAKQRHYSFLIYQPTDDPVIAVDFQKVIRNATVVAQFDGFGDTMSVSNSAFTEPLTVLFEKRSLGPNIIIFRLHE